MRSNATTVVCDELLFCFVLFCGWVEGWDTVISSLLFERYGSFLYELLLLLFKNIVWLAGRFLNERELLLLLFKNIVWLVVNSS